MCSILGGWMVAGLLAACGGGSGGGQGAVSAPGGSAGPVNAIGTVAVTVLDESGQPLPAAWVSVQDKVGSSQQGPADAKGEITFRAVRAGTATLYAGAQDYHTSQGILVQVETNRVATARITLQRRNAVTVAVLGTRRVALSPDGKRLEFETDLAVLDANGQPIPNLTAGAFTLPPFDCGWGICVNDSTGREIAAWWPVTGNPDAFTLVTPATRRPYAAGLLVDQGEWIGTHKEDPTRANAIVEFLQSFTGADQVALAEFQGLPSAPVLRTHGGFVGDGRSLVTVAQGLAARVGGSSPADIAVPQMLEFMAQQAPALQPTLVLVGNGWAADLWPIPSSTLHTLAAASRAAGIPISTIATSDNAADLAARTGGVFIHVEFPAQYRAALRGLGPMLAGEIPFYRMRFTVEINPAGAVQPGNTLYTSVRVSLGDRDRLYAMVALPL